LKEVMKIRQSRKGAYDMRMRRSTRKTGALILDLVTLTPAGAPLPAYYTRLRTQPRCGARTALRRSNTRRTSDTMHVTIPASHARMRNAREVDAYPAIRRAYRRGYSSRSGEAAITLSHLEAESRFRIQKWMQRNGRPSTDALADLRSRDLTSCS